MNEVTKLSYVMDFRYQYELAPWYVAFWCFRASNSPLIASLALTQDFAISIAVIHHFSSRDRRLAAVRECLRVVKPQNGTVFIQVWALEQQQGSKRNFTEQDNFVSWKLPVARYGGAKKANTAEEKPEPPKENEENVVYNRYYHLFKKGELDELVLECGGEILQSDYEKDNHFVICRPGKSQTIE